MSSRRPEVKYSVGVGRRQETIDYFKSSRGRGKNNRMVKRKITKRCQHSFLSQILDKKVEFSFECNVKDVFDSKVSFNFECDNFCRVPTLRQNVAIIH